MNPNNPEPNSPAQTPEPDVLFPSSPQPVAESSAPENSSAPVTPNPKKPVSKKTVAIIGVISGVVLLAIIGVVLYLMLMGVSKKDYQDAAKQYNAVSSASSKLSSKASVLSVKSTSESEDEFTTALGEAKDAVSTLKTDNEKLGSMKAVKVDEGKNLYATFDGKLTTYVDYANGLISSVEKIRPGMLTCRKVSSATDAASRLTAIKACSTGLNDMPELANPEFQAYITSLKTAYAKYATVYESINGLTNPYGSQFEQYKVLRDQMLAAQTDISNATKTFSADVKKHDDQVSVKESADALGNFLTEKQR